MHNENCLLFTATRQEFRNRFWNAYMLFYEAVDREIQADPENGNKFVQCLMFCIVVNILLPCKNRQSLSTENIVKDVSQEELQESTQEESHATSPDMSHDVSHDMSHDVSHDEVVTTDQAVLREVTVQDNIPTDIKRSINDENLHFLRHKEVYTEEYFIFIKNLVDISLVSFYFFEHECGPV